MGARASLLVTCEHATAAVPAWSRALLQAHLPAARQRALRAALATHRGFDVGAAALARRLATETCAPCLLGRASRLLVDLNRSARHPCLFSDFTRPLPQAVRNVLLARLWWPHWQAVARWLALARATAAQPAYHLAAHSFDPTLAPGRERIDVGLLYDPARPLERAWATAVRAALAHHAPGLRVRRNAPYRGVADGLPTALRKRLPPQAYAGMELELNRSLVMGPHGAAVVQQVASALARATPLQRARKA